MLADLFPQTGKKQEMKDFQDILINLKRLSPLRKIIGGVSVIFIIFAIITASSIISVNWQSSTHKKERTALELKVWTAEQKAQDFENLALRFKGQNDVLKLQNEAQAEILKANDKRLEGDAVKLNEILNKRKTTNEEISNSLNDYDYQRCQLCADCKRAGFSLSDSFCGRCQNNP